MSNIPLSSLRHDTLAYIPYSIAIVLGMIFILMFMAFIFYWQIRSVIRARTLSAKFANLSIILVLSLLLFPASVAFVLPVFQSDSCHVLAGAVGVFAGIIGLFFMVLALRHGPVDHETDRVRPLLGGFLSSASIIVGIVLSIFAVYVPPSEADLLKRDHECLLLQISSNESTYEVGDILEIAIHVTNISDMRIPCHYRRKYSKKDPSWAHLILTGPCLFLCGLDGSSRVPYIGNRPPWTGPWLYLCEPDGSLGFQYIEVSSPWNRPQATLNWTIYLCQLKSAGTFRYIARVHSPFSQECVSSNRITIRVRERVP
jgi:hypothetical protein